MAFVTFMNSPAGRLLRIVAGVAMIIVGLAAVGGAGGVVLAVVGVVPLLAGLLDVCLVGFLIRGRDA
ncbi:YgaP-like transmembrane domain [Aeromicrobium marinum]|uniref:YgaP-like transmembrane domain n=1 Tax=Aeromicrobium marinum TaxID=219314 RepID=UPI0001BCD7C7